MAESSEFSFFFLFFGHAVYGILVPRPGTEPMFLASKVWFLNHWTSGEVLEVPSFKGLIFLSDQLPS